MNVITQTITSGRIAPVNGFDSSGKVNILWTGGLDSTFRMIELSKEEIVIQPYYLCDKRNSERQELNALSLITEDILNHPDTKCTLLPLRKIKVAELEPDEAVSKAYQRLYKATRLGSQFDWLARFANSVPGLELSMEKSEMSKGYNCVSSFGRLKLIKRGNLSYYFVDKDHSTDDLVKIFGNFHFPYHLFHITKLKEYELYKMKGYEKSINKTWFCHTPINNKPCGVCHPCKSVIEEGLSFRLPPSAIRRYKRSEKYGETFFYRKLLSFRFRLEKLMHADYYHPPFSKKYFLHQNCLV